MSSHLSPLEQVINSLGSGIDKALTNIQSTMQQKAMAKQRQAVTAMQMPQRTTDNFGLAKGNESLETLPEQRYFDPRTTLNTSTVPRFPTKERSSKYVYGSEGMEAERGYGQDLNVFREMGNSPKGTFTKEQLETNKHLLDLKQENMKTLTPLINKFEQEGREAFKLMNVIGDTDFSSRDKLGNIEHYVRQLNLPFGQSIFNNLAQTKKGALMDVVSAKELAEYLHNFKGAVRTAEINAFYQQAVSSKNTPLANGIIQTLMQGELYLAAEKGYHARQILNDYPGITVDRFEALLNERMQESEEAIGHWINQRIFFLGDPTGFVEEDYRKPVELSDENSLLKGLSDGPPQDLPPGSGPLPPDSGPLPPDSGPLPPDSGPPLTTSQATDTVLEPTAPLSSSSSPENTIGEGVATSTDEVPDTYDFDHPTSASPHSNVSDFRDYANVALGYKPDYALTKEQVLQRQQQFDKAIHSPSEEGFVNGINELFDFDDIPSAKESLRQLSKTRQGRQMAKEILEFRDPQGLTDRKYALPAAARKGIEDLVGERLTPEARKLFEPIFFAMPKETMEVLNDERTRNIVKQSADTVYKEMTTTQSILRWSGIAGTAIGETILDMGAGLADIPINIGGLVYTAAGGKNFKPNVVGRQVDKLVDITDRAFKLSPKEKKITGYIHFGTSLGALIAASVLTGGAAGVAVFAAGVGMAGVKYAIDALAEGNEWNPVTTEGIKSAIDAGALLAFARLAKTKAVSGAKNKTYAKQNLPVLEEGRALGLDVSKKTYGIHPEETVRMRVGKQNKINTRLDKSTAATIDKRIMNHEPRLLDHTTPGQYINKAEVLYKEMKEHPHYNNKTVGVNRKELAQQLNKNHRALFEKDKSLVAPDQHEHFVKISREANKKLLDGKGKFTPAEAVETIQTLRNNNKNALNQNDPVRAHATRQFIDMLDNTFKESFEDISPELMKIWNEANDAYRIGHKKADYLSFHNKLENMSPEQFYEFSNSSAGRKEIKQYVGAEGAKTITDIARHRVKQQKFNERSKPTIPPRIRDSILLKILPKTSKKPLKMKFGSAPK